MLSQIAHPFRSCVHSLTKRSHNIGLIRADDAVQRAAASWIAER